MALITQQISYEDEQNTKKNWRIYRAVFNNDVVVFIYCPQNVRPVMLEAEYIGIGGTDDD